MATLWGFESLPGHHDPVSDEVRRKPNVLCEPANLRAYFFTVSNIYFLSPPDTEPSGGIKHLYRQVDILNRNGYSAAVVHDRPGFRHAWFENRTRVLHTQDAPINADDILVFPEVFGPQVSTFARGVRKVVFNQNCYRTFTLYGLDNDKSAPSYLDPDIVALVVASADAERYLRHAFPSKRLLRVSLGIDAALFSYQHEKKRSLAFMPRRLSDDVAQVINILRFRGVLDDVALTPIDKMSEAEVAAAMKESLIFLSFSSREGFGLPPAEAMACGCLVIGYTGGGGDEYFLPEWSYPVPDGDIVTFAQTVEAVLAGHSRGDADLAEKRRRASEFILDRYSVEREEASCLAAWREIAGEPRAGAAASAPPASGLVWESQAPVRWRIGTPKG